ncbi:MAG: 5-formyltetrahydrofolate cyclo-ligase [Promethearchaeota archaeon]
MPLITKSILIGKKVVLPRCIKNKFGKNDLEFIQIHDFKKDTEIGCFSILEPKKEIIDNNKEISLKDLDVIFVPGLAFDIKGNRLGYGAGYYDNFLKRLLSLNNRVVIIGVCFEFQLLTGLIPKDSHDVKMQYLTTSNRFIKCRSNLC